MKARLLVAMSLASCMAVGQARGAEAPCGPAQLSEPFEQRPGQPAFRLLVAWFSPDDPAAVDFGKAVGRSLAEALRKYLLSELREPAAREAGLAATDVQVRRVDCVLPGHDEARRLGQQVGADVVLFGVASRKPLPQVSVRQRASQRAGNVTVHGNGNRVQNIEQRVVILPGQPGSFKTYLTVVSQRGLETSADKAVPDAGYLNLGFPGLATQGPEALLRFALGLLAYQQQRHGFAARYLEAVRDEVTEGAEDQSGIYRVLGLNYLIAGPRGQGMAEGESVRRGLAALNEALRRCPRDALGCQAAAMNDLGWGHDAIGEKKKALAWYEKALPLSREVGDRGGEARTMNNIGGVYDDLGEKKKALAWYEKALPLFGLGRWGTGAGKPGR